MDVRQVISDTATLLQNSPERSDAHAIAVDVPDAAGVVPGGRGADPPDRLEPGDQRAARDARRRAAALSVTADDRPDGRQLVMAVRDDGVGIAPEDLDGILQPFQGGFARGTGLGLSIVHRIVSDYGGDLQMAPHRRKGTTVTVKLPVAGRPEAQAVARRDICSLIMSTDRSQHASPRRRPRHACSSSTTSARCGSCWRSCCRRDGHEVLVAEDGRSALEMLRRQRVDILITDIRMPEMNGVDVLREAKQIDPDDHQHRDDRLRLHRHRGRSAAARRRGLREQVVRTPRTSCGCGCARSWSASSCSRRTCC